MKPLPTFFGGYGILLPSPDIALIRKFVARCKKKGIDVADIAEILEGAAE